MSNELDHLSPEDRKILSYMFRNLNVGPREVAKIFGTTIEHIHDILVRDLKGIEKW